VLAPGIHRHEGIMEYFLIPRDVQDCDRAIRAVRQPVPGPTTYVLATRGSRCRSRGVGYRFVAFDEANWEFRLLCADRGAVIAQPLEPVAALTVRESRLPGACPPPGSHWISVASALAGPTAWMTLGAGFPLGAALSTFSLSSPLGWRALDAMLLLVVVAAGRCGPADVPPIVASLGGRCARGAPAAGGLQSSRRLAVLLAGCWRWWASASSRGGAVVLRGRRAGDLSIKGYGMYWQDLSGRALTGSTRSLVSPQRSTADRRLRLATGDLLPISKLAFRCSMPACCWYRTSGVATDSPERSSTDTALAATVPLIQFHSTLGLANLPLAIYWCSCVGGY